MIEAHKICTNNKPKAIDMINSINRPDTSFHVWITECSDTLIIVQIIKGSYKGGSTVFIITIQNMTREKLIQYIKKAHKLPTNIEVLKKNIL